MSNAVTVASFDGRGKVILREVVLPAPGPGDVVVSVKASGVCGSDLHQLMGRWPQPEFAPGHEVAGVVAEVGSEVSSPRLGDRVCIEPFACCGECDYCRAGRYMHCPRMGFLSLSSHGGLAQTVLAPSHACYRLPDTASLEIGALAEPLAVAVHGARLAALSASDAVLVLGAGTIGLMCLAAARHFGAPKCYITARHEHQAKAALALGADAVLSTETEALRAEIHERLGRGPQVVMEAVGSAAKTFQQAIELAAPLARVALMGGNTGPMDGIDLAPVINKELTLYGSGCYGRMDGKADFDIALEILGAEPAAFEHLITHRFPLSDIQQAFDTALDKASTGAIKVMVVG